MSSSSQSSDAAKLMTVNEGLARLPGPEGFGDQRKRFGGGDFLVVPAGMVHRFEQFTDDLIVRVNV